MEIYVNYLAIEVTRRCNMKCEPLPARRCAKS